MISIHNLTKTVGKNILFHIDDAVFPDSGLVVIQGENGCGKTTLFNILSLLDNRYEGRVEYDGVSYWEQKEKYRTEFRKNHICYVFQKNNMISFLSVEENSNVYSKEKVRSEKQIHELSQGQQERTILDSACSLNKDIYLFDEVLSCLDEKNREAVIFKIKELSKHHLVLLVSHDVVLSDAADEVYRLEEKTLKRILVHKKESSKKSEEKRTFSLNKKRILKEYLFHDKLKMFFNTLLMSLMFVFVYLGSYALKNDSFLYLYQAIRSSDHVEIQMNHTMTTEEILNRFPDSCYEMMNQTPPIAFFKESKDDSSLYCNRMTYEKYDKFIVDRNLVYNGVSQKVEIDDSLKGFVFYQYRNSDSSDNAIFEQNLYYDTDIKDTSYTSGFKFIYSESYFRNRYPEFRDMVFETGTFYVFSPFLYSSRHITHFRNVPYSSMEEAYRADYNEIFPDGIETVLLDPKGKDLSGVIVLNDSDMDRIVERYRQHSDIFFLPGKDDFKMARFIADHYLPVQVDKDTSKRTKELIETYNSNTSGYYVSIFTYGLLSFFFLLMILFVQVLWYIYSLRKHRQDFRLLSSYGMTSEDIYLVSVSPMLFVLSLSSLIGGLLSLFQTKGITSMFFGSAIFLVLVLLFLLVSCFIHRRRKKNLYPNKGSYFSVRRNIPFLVIDGLITALSMFFLSCLVFDSGRMNNLSEEEYPIYRMFGLEGITVQSYLFPFLALLLVIVFTGVLFDYFIIDDIKGNLFLLVVKGDGKIRIRTEITYGLSALLSMGLSTLLYYFAVLSMNTIFHTSIPIFVFDPRVLILAFSVLLFRLLLFSSVLKRMLKPKRLLSYLRERY